MAEDGPLSQADIDALTAGLLGDAATAGVDAVALRPEVDAILEQGASVLGTLLNRRRVHVRPRNQGRGRRRPGRGLDDQGLIVRLALEHGLAGGNLPAAPQGDRGPACAA